MDAQTPKRYSIYVTQDDTAESKSTKVPAAQVRPISYLTKARDSELFCDIFLKRFAARKTYNVYHQGNHQQDQRFNI